MVETARTCELCSSPAEYVCAYCPKTSFYCSAHQCAHLVTGSPHPADAMQELSKPTSEAQGFSKILLGVFALAGFLVALAWLFSSADPSKFFGKIFVLFAIFVAIFVIYGCLKTTKSKSTTSSNRSPSNLQEGLTKGRDATDNMKTSTTAIRANAVSTKKQTEPYFDAFLGFAMRLSQSIPLSEWATGIPKDYALEESESIEAVHRARQSLPYTTASRFVEEPLQKLICEIGLVNCAREDRTSSYDEWGPDLPPERLESITSTFLKAWLCNSNPFVLLELADFLAVNDREREASEAVDVALRFPDFAKTITLNDMEMVAQTIAYELFPSGPSREARSLSQGLNSPKALALLSEEVKRLQEKWKEIHTDRNSVKQRNLGEESDNDVSVPPLTVPNEDRLKTLWEAWQRDGSDGIANVWEEEDPVNLPTLPVNDGPRGKTMLSKGEALRAYAAMMNSLDSRNFEPLLAHDFHYASQWVFDEIESKHEYLDYITGKLEAVKASGKKLWAEMASCNSGPCVVMAEGEPDNLIATVLVEVERDKIKRIDLCCVPSPYSAERSGDYPT